MGGAPDTRSANAEDLATLAQVMLNQSGYGDKSSL